MLIGPDLDIRQARVIVDGDMHVFPAHTARAALPIAMGPVAGLTEAAERLDVDMHHVAGL